MPNDKPKILVTGGAGFIGSHTAVELHKAGFEPVLMDNLVNSYDWIVDRVRELTGEHLSFHQKDCRSKNEFRVVFEKEKNLVGVIHFAAYKAVGESMEKPLKYYDNNLGSLTALLEVMEEYGVRNIVFSSSCTVYGQPNELPVTEKAPVQMPFSPYGRTKMMCEHILQDTVAASEDLKGVSLRYFNPIGAHPSSKIGELPLGKPTNLVPFITQAAAGQRDELAVHGNDYDTPDGTCVRDYIHVVDLAKAHVKALERLGEGEEEDDFEVFNLGTGKGDSVLEVIKGFEKTTGVKVPYVIGPRRAGDVAQIWADTTKAYQVLGWRTELTLEDALRDAWKWEGSENRKGVK